MTQQLSFINGVYMVRCDLCGSNENVLKITMRRTLETNEHMFKMP